MSRPLVAVVGRPNVGKSTLFNRLIGHRVAIVEDTPGITRDRLYHNVEWRGIEFTVIDTGGIILNETDPLAMQVRTQAEIAMAEADVILFVVDAADGMTSTDQDIADVLRASQQPLLAGRQQDRQPAPAAGRRRVLCAWAWARSTPSPPRTATASPICSTRSSTLFPARLRRRRGGRGRDSPRHHRAAQRRQILPAQLDPGRGARHRQPASRHHPRHHRHRFRVGRPEAGPARHRGHPAQRQDPGHRRVLHGDARAGGPGAQQRRHGGDRRLDRRDGRRQARGGHGAGGGPRLHHRRQQMGSGRSRRDLRKRQAAPPGPREDREVYRSSSAKSARSWSMRRWSSFRRWSGSASGTPSRPPSPPRRTTRTASRPAS